MMAVTASEARKKLFPLIEQVNKDRMPVEITSKRGDAVLISRDDSRALEEIARGPFAGIGKPEQLRHALAGAWSRRIDQESPRAPRSPRSPRWPPGPCST